MKAADQKITAWARQLKRAGLPGSMDELRAHAYLDLLLGTDSRPRPDRASQPDGIPAGFTGRINLTVPLVTLLGLADRPAEIPGLGPIDPNLARDLACRRPAAQCDFEHNIPYEAGGRTCLCNGGPKCRLGRYCRRRSAGVRWEPGLYRRADAGGHRKSRGQQAKQRSGRLGSPWLFHESQGRREW